MAVGENNFDRLKADALEWHPESSERMAWVQIVLSLLTQASSLAAFPSYNVVLGFWGLYSVFSKSLQAIQVYVGLLFFSTILDIVFCFIWGSNDAGLFEGYTAKFCLTMLTFNMLAKCAAIRSFLRFYKEIEAHGVIHPHHDRSTTRHGQAAKTEQGGVGVIGSGAYDMAPLSTRSEERAPIESPQGEGVRIRTTSPLRVIDAPGVKHIQAFSAKGAQHLSPSPRNVKMVKGDDGILC